MKGIKNRKILAQIDQVIERIEAAARVSEIKGVTKMAGDANAYRIRVGGFRIGFYLNDDTVELVRCLARKDIYRYFP